MAFINIAQPRGSLVATVAGMVLLLIVLLLPTGSRLYKGDIRLKELSIQDFRLSELIDFYSELANITLIVRRRERLHRIPQLSENATRRIERSRNQTKKYERLPIVCIAVNVKNGHAFNLPYFLGALEQTAYPKDRLIPYFSYEDEESRRIVDRWLDIHNGSYYSYFSFEREGSSILARVNQEVSQLPSKTDYIWLLDSDVIISNATTLPRLIMAKRPIVAPLLNSSTPEFVNFNHADPAFVENVRNGTYQGIFRVKSLLPGSACLYSLKWHKMKQFIAKIKPDESKDSEGIHSYIVNDAFFGFMPKPNAPLRLAKKQWLSTVLTKNMVKQARLSGSNLVPHVYDGFVQPVPHKLGFDEIYIILNDTMRDEDSATVKVLHLLDIGYNRFQFGALLQTPIDVIGDEELHKLDRHYRIWRDAVAKQHEQILVIDLREKNQDLWLSPEIHAYMDKLFHVVDAKLPQWDLINLLGSKQLAAKFSAKTVKDVDNLLVEGAFNSDFVYALSKSGAKKLVDGDPYQNMHVLGEYLYSYNNLKVYSDVSNMFELV